MNPSKETFNQEKLAALRAAAGAGPVLILTHDNPDPDAFASGEALAFLLKEAWGIESRLVYSGVVGRAENWAMLRFLTSGWEHLDVLPDLGAFSAVALLDTQPGAGNNRLPTDARPQIVFDHHVPPREGLDGVPFVELQTELGATVSILHAYLEAAGLRPGTRLATAMFYGLKTDTRALSRGATEYDERLYLKLLGLLDRQLLQKVEQAGLSREYFIAFDKGLRAATVHGTSVFAYLDEMTRPDLAAEMADLLIRLDGSRAALCLGTCTGVLYISLRTRKIEHGAGSMIPQIVPPPGTAGGHDRMAGGQVPLDGQVLETLVSSIRGRFLELMEEPVNGEPLLGAENG